MQDCPPLLLNLAEVSSCPFYMTYPGWYCSTHVKYAATLPKRGKLSGCLGLWVKARSLGKDHEARDLSRRLTSASRPESFLEGFLSIHRPVAVETLYSNQAVKPLESGTSRFTSKPDKGLRRKVMLLPGWYDCSHNTTIAGRTLHVIKQRRVVQRHCAC